MLYLLVNTGFQVLFHSPPGVLFTFPSRYSFTIGHWVVFRLTGWSPRIPTGFHVPDGTLDTAGPLSISNTGLSPTMVCLPRTFLLSTSVRYAVRTPKVLLPPVWPLSISLAATLKIDFSFSSSAYLDVSVQRVPLIRLFYSPYDDNVLRCRVSTFGNLRVNGYLLLTAAYRSLSRPSSAPNAKAFALRSLKLNLSRFS